ncbi:MAG: BLUF domain-containing protein [Pseudomonadota bacterium]|nr:BLUF domain-containing protein [Pseudomonadota bacterium]
MDAADSRNERSLGALVYVSAATRDLEADELSRLLGDWQTSNTRCGITGVLLHRDGDFLQYLEGTDLALTRLYARIRVDPRHGGVIELLREPITEREFPDWPLRCVLMPSISNGQAQHPEEDLRWLLEPSQAWRSPARLLLTTFWQTRRSSPFD